MLFTASGMAFAHGSNDVANGVGPMAAVVGLIESGGEITQKSNIPLWILLLGGFGIVVGLATYGYKVMRTIGTKITELTPTRGFCATMAAATTVVLASRTGMPVSTTHIAVGGCNRRRYGPGNRGARSACHFRDHHVPGLSLCRSAVFSPPCFTLRCAGCSWVD